MSVANSTYFNMYKVQQALLRWQDGVVPQDDASVPSFSKESSGALTKLWYDLNVRAHIADKVTAEDLITKARLCADVATNEESPAAVLVAQPAQSGLHGVPKLGITQATAGSVIASAMPRVRTATPSVPPALPSAVQATHANTPAMTPGISSGQLSSTSAIASTPSANSTSSISLASHLHPTFSSASEVDASANEWDTTNAMFSLEDVTSMADWNPLVVTSLPEGSPFATANSSSSMASEPVPSMAAPVSPATATPHAHAAHSVEPSADASRWPYGTPWMLHVGMSTSGDANARPDF
jgi:hypothetical protein